MGGGLAEAAPETSPTVLLGKSNTTGGTTRVTSSKGTGLSGHAALSNQAGVAGFNAGTGENSFGLLGHSMHGTGVNGISDHGNGVVGNTKTVGFSGVAGIDFSATRVAQGVYGQSNVGDAVLGVSFAGTGVTGTCKVAGQSGVFGLDQTPKAGSNGVSGQSPHGVGVSGASPHGTGLLGQSAHGLGLHVLGKARFGKSGVASVPAGQRTTTVQVSGMTTSDFVLATIQRPQSGVFIEAAQPRAGSFTITLSRNAASALPVAWFVLS